MYTYTNTYFTPDWTLIIAQISTVVKIDVLCSDFLTDRLLGSTLILVRAMCVKIAQLWIKA